MVIHTKLGMISIFMAADAQTLVGDCEIRSKTVLTCQNKVLADSYLK